MQTGFRVGEWQVEPRQRLISNGQRRVRLEPKSMAVLCVLAEAGGEPVSRDALIEAAWAGRVVSDDAVTRQVAKLRQALGDDPRCPRYIETIPKTGFRLMTVAEPAEQAARAPVRHGRRWLAAAAALTGLAVLAAALERGGPAPAGIQLSQITAAPGLEVHPSPSPSGRAVVYSARAADAADFDLFVHDPETGAPRRLTTGPENDLYPAWSPDGERIAFVRVAPEQCQIHLLAVYATESRMVAGCREAHRGGGLAWSPDGAAVYFADRENAREPFALQRLDTQSRQVTRLLEPPAGAIGDTAPRVGADGRVAFLRVRTLGVEDAYVLEREGRPRRVTFDDGKIHGLAWHGNGLVVSSNRRGGLFGLWHVGPEDLRLQRLPAPPGADGPGSNGRVLVFEQWSSQVDLWSAPLDGGEPEPVARSTRWDWWPAVSPDGSRLAWTSDRSGAAELWMAAIDGSSPRRLTRFEGPYTQAAVWAPDGGSLVVAAPVQGQFELFAVDVASGETRRLTDTPEDEAAPVFAPDGRLLFRRESASGPALVDEQGAVVAADVRGARFAPDGELWFTRPAQPGLWRLRSGVPERVTVALETVDWQNWWVDDDGVHLIVRPRPDHPRLARLDPATGDLQVVRELPELLYKSGLARHGDAVIYGREARHEADIFRLGPETPSS